MNAKGILLKLNIPQRKYLTDSNIFTIANIPGYIPDAHVDPLYDAVHVPTWYMQIKYVRSGTKYRLCMRFPKTRKFTYCGQMAITDNQLTDILSLNDCQVAYKPDTTPTRSKEDRFFM